MSNLQLKIEIQYKLTLILIKPLNNLITIIFKIISTQSSIEYIKMNYYGFIIYIIYENALYIFYVNLQIQLYFF